MKWILIILIFVSVGCRRDVDSATKTYTQQKGDEPPTDLILIIDGRVEVGNIVGCIDFLGNDTILSVDTNAGKKVWMSARKCCFCDTLCINLLNEK